MEEFSKVIYENLDNIRQDDVSNGITQLFETVKTPKRGQSVLINQFILILNDIFDAFPPSQTGQKLKETFQMTLETLEKIIRSNCSTLGMETLTNSAYYFCKFQVGTDEFWNIMETQIIKSKDTLSIE
jgi:hypothetical protein